MPRNPAELSSNSKYRPRDFFSFRFHRLASIIHRPWSGSDLTPIAGSMFNAVIYVMIASKMKVSSTTTIGPTAFTRMQWFTTVIGIVIAITCSLLLLSDLQSSKSQEEQFAFRNTSMSVTIHEVVATPDATVMSVLAMF
jgi:hypothetical protein